MSVLKWIWGLLRRLWGLVDHLVRFVVGIASSVMAWVIAGFAWLVHSLFQYVGAYFQGLFESLEGISVGNLQVEPLANWLGRDVLALDVGWECVIICISVWFATKLARLSFTWVRLIIDLL